MRSSRSLAGVVVALVLTLVLAACGSGSGPGGGDRNEADEIFVEVAGGSVGSLRQILQLADDSADAGEVVDLAAEIEATLSEVADQLADWEDEWDLPQELSSTVADGSSQDKSDDWKRLEELEGEDFDTLWTTVVTDSVEAVRSSAETVVERGADPDVRALAEQLAEDCADWVEQLADLDAGSG